MSSTAQTRLTAVAALAPQGVALAWEARCPLPRGASPRNFTFSAVVGLAEVCELIFEGSG